MKPFVCFIIGFVVGYFFDVIVLLKQKFIIGRKKVISFNSKKNPEEIIEEENSGTTD